MRFATSTIQGSMDSPLGRIILAASDGRLSGVWFEGQRHQPDTRAWVIDDRLAVFDLTRTQLRDYFAGRRTSFELPLDISAGSDFQQAVWRALLAIPFGATASYGAISAAVGKPAAVRAVGAAVGRNPLSIVVPCHRVIGADGALTGYAGGLPRKTSLLQLEGAL